MTDQTGATDRTIVVVSAGLSQPSATRLLGDRLGAAVRADLAKLGSGLTVEVVELRERAQDLVNQLLTGFPSPALADVIRQVTGADGLIVVSPIFNASYSGLFKLFFDVVERDGLAGTPVLLAATGGTERHSLALEYAMRPLFAYLGAATVPTAVYAASSDWGTEQTSASDDLTARIGRAARELARAVALTSRPQRADPFAQPVPFDDLLRSVRDSGRADPG